MQTKAYFASSVPAALEVARQELGENALLVSSRPTPPHARQYGRLEVTFAWDPREAVPQSGASKRTETAPAWRSIAAGSRSEAPRSEVEDIRQQLSALRVAVNRGAQLSGTDVPNGGPGGTFESALIVERMVEAGFSREISFEIASGPAGKSGNPDAAVARELAGRISIAPHVELKSGENRTLAFVGPPGRGKTSSLVKIAVNLGLARRIPVRIYCAGAHCVGAPEQLARFAAILGTPFQACESLASLNLALNGEGWKGLTLIDTPGISPADQSQLLELKSFFMARTEIEKHLVLRADASSADMLHMVGRFSGLAPTRLLVTGTDEAIRLAPVIEVLIRGGIAGTFAGTGQEIPDDMEELNAEKLVRAVWARSGLASPAPVTGAKFAQAAA